MDNWSWTFCEQYFLSLLIIIFTSDISIKEESTISAKVALEWQEPSLSTGKVKNYIVLYKLSQPSNYWNVVRTNDTQVYLRDIQPKSEYTVRVLVLTTSNVTYQSQAFTLEPGIGMSFMFIFY